ncbi:MAG TPA: hypothetical protein VJV78_11410 [Polyangiales bacterium]|nr:hypothetical protein [Polyangiales bacterium]
MRFAASLCVLCALAACSGDDEMPSGSDAGERDSGSKPRPDDDAGMDDAGTDVAPRSRVCSSDGFCWELPSPQGETLRAAFSSGDDTLWAVGDHGVVLRYDHGAFSAADSGTKQDLLAVHGSSASDVWAVGKGGSVLHYDGGKWSTTDLTELIDASGGAKAGVLYGVFALAPDAVWAVGHTGVSAVIVHYDGKSWSSQVLAMTTPQPLRAIWGLSRDKIWAVGDAGQIRSYDGFQWTPDKSPTAQPLSSVHALVAHDVWAVGANGAAVRWNGSMWSNVNTGLSGGLFSVRVEIEAPAMPSDAGMPMMMPAAGSGADAGPPPAPMGPWSVWAFGEKGHVFRYNGSVWAAMASGTELPLYAATRVKSGTLIAVGDRGQISRFSGEARQSMTAGARRNHLGLWGDGKTLWAVGDDISRHDAGGWSAQNTPNERSLYGVWGDDKGVWAVGTGGAVARHENGAWQARQVTAAGEAWLHSVWGAGNSVWIVGDQGLTLVAAAGSFIKVATPVKSNLLDVWGSADDSFWAVGEGGAVLRWDGMAWLKVPTGPMGGVVQNLRAVWGSARDDVWVVGTEGTILHWTGERFESQSRTAKYSLNDVWGRGRDDVYAVGSSGVALHYDGTEWRELETGTRSSLQSVFGDGGRVYCAGLDGVLLVRE